MIRAYWEKIRPTSTDEDPEANLSENEILKFRNRRLQLNIRDCLNNSRKQEKIINQLNLKNETLNNEKLNDEKLKDEKLKNEILKNQALNNEISGTKFNCVMIVFILSIVASICVWQIRDGNENGLQSRDREIQNYKSKLHEKSKELDELEKRFNRQENENQRVESERQNCQNDLKETQNTLKSRDRENCE